ncbi:MAG: DUF86 domain-containing protein [Campylobacterales bacterium]|nr:DUF86 domain-containing protein [Campylobacterales bacterium]
MYNDIKKLRFVLEKIDDVFSFKDEFGSVEKLLNSKLGYDATLMCIVQIGETLKKKFSSNFYEKYENLLPINQSYWTRNYIAHDYEGINKLIIEGIVREHLPKLKTTIETILSELENSKK